MQDVYKRQTNDIAKSNPRATHEELVNFILADLDKAEIGLESYTPAVSYTHLDVYKRQAGCTDLDTEPLSSTITSNQKEEVVESDPSRLEASVAAVDAHFTQYAKIYTEDDNVHRDIGYPTIMLATDSRGTDMVADITGYNWYSNSADYSRCV